MDSCADRLIDGLDRMARTLAGVAPARAPRPDAGLPPDDLSAAQKTASARLMRVNHAGEIAAQGLYAGQALGARDPQVRARLRRCADEEGDHLAWCDARIRELGGRVSRLTPFWLAGSFALGAVAGLLGDRASLGFVEETERQVGAHLASHLKRMPADDRRSRAILERMRADELAHAEHARAAGGQAPPRPVKALMRAAARVMTTVAYRL